MLAATAVVAVTVFTLVYARWSGFEPGGGGAEELPAQIAADGSLRLQLRLKVWGGGGPITGRYQGVVLRYRQVPAQPYARVAGRRLSGDAVSELYAFDLPPLSSAAGGAMEYAFDVQLDGQASTIPGKGIAPFLVPVAPAAATAR